MKKFNITAVIIFLGVTLAAVPINSGLGFPDNGPCTPTVGSAGLCNDSGVLAVYDDQGNIVHLPVAGPQGPQGVQGPQGAQGSSGPQGPQGPSGTAKGTTAAITITCKPAKGSIQAGFTANCTVAFQ